MTNRINDQREIQGLYQQMMSMERYLASSSLDHMLLHLVKMRASQINGCAYCMALHAKDLREGGEREDRIYVLNAWREAPWFSDRERAALAWTEALTTLTNREVSDEVFQQAREQFTERELSDLTLAVIAINGWNRISIGYRNEPVPFTIDLREPVSAD